MLILKFLLNPLNDVLILMQFEGLTAIMALSSKKDILDCGAKWIDYNQKMLTFVVSIQKGIVSLIPLIVQALATALNVLTVMAQATINTITTLAGGFIAFLAALLI
jgi:hypothetical protein